MNPARLTRIAQRISVLLVRELGHGVDVKRMLAEPLYARDVLLVCDAYPGSDLASLAQHYRSALADAGPAEGAASNFATDSSLFGSASQPPADSQFDGRPAPVRRRWMSPSRWLGR